MIRTHIAAALAALSSAIAVQGAIPVRWTTDCFKVKPLSYECYHGETLDLASSVTAYGEPLDFGGKTARLYWQTNGMSSAWWSTNAFVRVANGATNVLAAIWSGAYDTGARTVTGFIGVEGEIYRAAFELRFRDSPGFLPSSLPLPTPIIDCARVTFLHPEAAPFGGGGSGGVTTNAGAAVSLTVDYEYATRSVAAPASVTCVSGEIVTATGVSGTLNVVFPAEVANKSADFILRVVATGASQLGTLTISGGGTVTPEWLCDALTTTGKIAANKTTYIFFSRVAANTYVINAQEVK